MSNILFGQGKQNIGNKSMNLGSDTLKGTLLTMSSAAGKIALVSGATNATPIVVTTGTHGYSTNDIVVVGGVGGNLAANGTWQLGTTTTTTFQLLTRVDGANSTGSGAYTSGGWCIDVSTAAVLSDVSGNSLGTDVSLTGVTNTLGVINASPCTWSSLTATKVWALGLYDSTASNELIAWIDGTYQVYVITQAASSSTAIAVARLQAAIASGTVLQFSDGTSATLTAQANVGDTSLTVSSTAATIHRQATADVVTLNCGLPVTPAASGSLTLTPDSGVNKLFVI
jgi:hypothetical protein